MSKGLLVVLSGPSGTGKGTVVKYLLDHYEGIRLSVSATTRGPREGEVNGQHYFFVTREEFEQMIREGKVLEYAEYCGRYYGTPLEPIQRWREQNDLQVAPSEAKRNATIWKRALPIFF